MKNLLLLALVLLVLWLLYEKFLKKGIATSAPQQGGVLNQPNR